MALDEMVLDSMDPDRALTPVSVPSAYQVVAERLRGAIHLGMFGTGERLPPERELARRLGVSRVTLREALRELEEEGYIVTRRGSTGGPVVTTHRSPDELRRDLVDHIGFFDEVMDFRVAVEGAAARLAALRRSDDDVASLEASVEAIAGSLAVTDFRRADSAFHLQIASASGNSMLYEAIETARERMFTPVDVLAYEVMVDTTLSAHRRVLSAIARRQPAAAERAMVAHVSYVHDELRQTLGLEASSDDR